MGDLLFKVPQALQYDVRVWNSAYITGIEGIPWHCHHRVSGDEFNIGREIDESGKLNIVWPTSTLGKICLSTTSLRLAPEPYMLSVEIARGTVNRLRTQTSEWQRIGLRLPESFFPLAEEALTEFLKAVTGAADRNQQQIHAQAAIDLAMRATVQLCDCYSEQALEARKQSEGRLATLQGIEIGLEKTHAIHSALDKTFNLVSVPAGLGAVETSSGKSDFSAFDAQVSWASRHNKKICVGPLVNFSKGNLPKWIVLLDEGFDSVLKTACEHAQACVQRYRGKAHIWNCAAGLNTRGDMNWTDEQTLRMAVSIIETVRRADERSPVLLTIDQPWSEYLRKEDDGISPLHFADALIRADLGLSGLSLDLRFGDAENDSFPRDPIEVSRLIDRWAMLGLPLMVQLSTPTSDTPGATWQTPETCEGRVAPETIVKLLLAKPCIHAVIWTQLADPAGGPSVNGLWDARGQAKPTLAKLTQVRSKFLH